MLKLKSIESVAPHQLKWLSTHEWPRFVVPHRPNAHWVIVPSVLYIVVVIAQCLSILPRTQEEIFSFQTTPSWNDSTYILGITATEFVQRWREELNMPRSPHSTPPGLVHVARENPWEHLENLLQQRCLGPIPKISSALGLGAGSEATFLTSSLHDSEAIGPGAPRWDPPHQHEESQTDVTKERIRNLCHQKPSCKRQDKIHCITSFSIGLSFFFFRIAF